MYFGLFQRWAFCGTIIGLSVFFDWRLAVPSSNGLEPDYPTGMTSILGNGFAGRANGKDQIDDGKARGRMVTELRRLFPSRRGMVLVSEPGPTDRLSPFNALRIEVDSAREHWRFTMRFAIPEQKTIPNAGNVSNPYVLFESIASVASGQILQSQCVGTAGVDQEFVALRSGVSTVTLNQGNFAESGAGLFLGRELLFGLVRAKTGLDDMHSSGFEEQCRLIVDGEKTVALEFEPGGYEFEFSVSTEKLIRIRQRSEWTDANGVVSIHTSIFEPTGETFGDGGLKSFAVSSDRPGSLPAVINEFDKLVPLKANVGLNQFSICKVREGTRVVSIAEPTLLLLFNDGKAVRAIDPDAEREIEAVLDGDTANLEDSGSAFFGGDDSAHAETGEGLPGNLDRISYLRSVSSAHCGLYSLAIAAARLKKRIPIDQLVTGTWSNLQVGSSADDLLRASKEFGLHAEVVRFADLNMLGVLGVPAVIHSGNSYQVEGVSHWMAILEVDIPNRKALLADLPHKPQWLTEAELLAWWDGTAILISDRPINLGQIVKSRLGFLISLAIVLGLLLGISLLLRLIGAAGRPALEVAVLVLTAAVLGAAWTIWIPAAYSKNPDARAMLTGKTSELQMGNWLTELWQWDTAWVTDDETVIVDARLPKDFYGGHAIGAINLPVDCSVMELKLVWERVRVARRVIVYCQSSQCGYSHQVGSLLHAMGVEEVVIFRPGYNGLRSAESVGESGAMVK